MTGGIDDCGRDSFVQFVYEREYRRREAERRREVDELIAAGWGHVDAARIPENWRELQPPAKAVPPHERAGKIDRNRQSECHGKEPAKLPRRRGARSQWGRPQGARTSK